METPTTDAVPSPTLSAIGLKSVIAKAKINRKDEASPNSPASLQESKERNGGRNSIDSLVRNSTRSSVSDGLPPGPSSMSKLIPGRAKMKRRKREEAERILQLEELARGRDPNYQTATAAANGTRLAASKSQSTLDDDDEDNSLITVDSETEPSGPLPPPLINRESHSGYLTASSPLIKTTAADDAPAKLQLDSPGFKNPQYQKTNTLPTNPSFSSFSPSLSPQHAATFANNDAERSPSVAEGSRSRGVSPGARIKDVLSIGSRKKSSSPPKSPNRMASSDKEKKKPAKLTKISNASESVLSIDTASTRTPKDSNTELPQLNEPPQTPPGATLHAPETTVTPPTPVDQRRDSVSSLPSKGRPASSSAANSNIVVSPSGNMISHRRIRSDSAARPLSKLSSAMAPPLTPMAEEGRTPGSRSPSGNLAGGFFSSVFSAAQNVTNTLTNTMNMNPPRSRSSTRTTEETITPTPEEPVQDENFTDSAPAAEKKALAVETLGAGDLSLSHLGIDMPATAKSTNSTSPSLTPNADGNVILVHREEEAARAEDVSAARAVSAAYSERPVSEAGTTIVTGPSMGRPRSNYEPSIAPGDMTPPNGSINDVDVGFKRSSSVRSRVGAVTRKHRNSSSVTGGTIGAALVASQAGLANTASAGSAPKLTGFAVASKKRNRDFHQLFRSVPEDDYLIEDYSCALQRDIILAGRIYVSEGHICFSSNILGWVTILVISFDEVVSIEKENTAVVFPNAIAVQTLQARHTFRSLLSREATYELLIGIWKLNHPTLKSSVNGVRLDSTDTGDKTEKIEAGGSDDASNISDEEEVYDEDDDERDGVASVNGAGNGSVAGSDDSGDQPGKTPARKASSMGTVVGAAAGSVPTTSDAKAAEKAAAASAATADFPGPATHEPTECTDSAVHYDKLLKDDIIPAPLGKVYSMVFGPASGGFMAKWLLDEIKVTQLQMEDDKKGLTEQGQSRSYTYIKPLYAPIGPKTTKCLVTETLDYIDLERSVSVTASTQTPDVPSGNIFVCKTRFCFMWAPGNQTRAIMNYNIEWSGKSWIKGAIEKGATDGQGTYCNDLVKALKLGIAAGRPRTVSKTKPSKSVKRRKTERANSKDLPDVVAAVNDAVAKSRASWGLFEPLHPILGPVGDILSPFISANMIIGFLVLIILLNYLRSPSSKSVSRTSGSSSQASYYGNQLASPERVAAYETIWQREEADLWDWLEQRVSMHAASASGGSASTSQPGSEWKQKPLVSDQVRNGARSKLEQLKMGGREVEEAIRVTEDRLEVLKNIVMEGKQSKTGDKPAAEKKK